MTSTVIGLPPDDVEEVRKRTLRLACEHGWAYSEIARRAHLELHQVGDFLSYRTGSERVVVHLIAYLPLDLVYQPAKILPR